MPQVFNLRGDNVQTLAELRVDTIKNQDASFDIITVDNTNQSVTLHNVEKIFTRLGRELDAEKIKVM